LANNLTHGVFHAIPGTYEHYYIIGEDYEDGASTIASIGFCGGGGEPGSGEQLQ
jgi:hypothetical protein